MTGDIGKGGIYDPPKLRGNKFFDIRDKVCSYIKRGNSMRASFLKAGVTDAEYYHWKKYRQEELEEGHLNSPCIDIFDAVEKAFAESEADLSSKAKELALDGNPKLLMYLLDTLHGWKIKEEIELKAPDTGLEINIVGMENPYEKDNGD